jgi:hypothetical protein
VGDNHVHVGTNELGRQFRQARDLAQRPAVLDDYGGTLDVAEIGKALSESTELVRKPCCGRGPEEADPGDPVGLLRARRERPCGRAAEQRYERASAGHSITSSARNKSDVGMEIPSA